MEGRGTAAASAEGELTSSTVGRKQRERTASGTRLFVSKPALEMHFFQ